MKAAKCSCRPGEHLCPEAERLWRAYLGTLTNSSPDPLTDEEWIAGGEAGRVYTLHIRKARKEIEEKNRER